MDYLNRAYAWAAPRLPVALGGLPLDPEARARKEEEWARRREERAQRHAEREREFAEAFPHDSPNGGVWFVLSLLVTVTMPWLFPLTLWPFVDQPTTPLSWTLDPTSPYHVVASLPGEAFTYAQVTKLEIGWEVAPIPAEFNDGGWRGRAINPVGFYPLQEKLDLHYHDLVAKHWPDNRGVGVALGHNAGIVEFIAAISIYSPDSRRPTQGGGALINHVAIVPGAKGGNRLGLPRLLKEGWVLIGKEEVEESKEAAKQRKREEMRSGVQYSSSGGYAWNGSNEFEGHKEGGWKHWAPTLAYWFQNRGIRPPTGGIPVLTLRHRWTGVMLKAKLQGDAWVVRTLVEDNTPQPKGWKRIISAVFHYANPLVWWREAIHQ